MQGDFIGGKEGRALPMVLFGITAIVAGGLAQILPETKGRKLPDTIKDAEKMSRYDKCFIINSIKNLYSIL